MTKPLSTVFPCVLILCLTAVLSFGTPAHAQGGIDVVYPDNTPRIGSDFRSRRGINGPRRPSRHQGIDIKGRNGQPIIAIASGTVLESDVGTCWGPTVVIDHGRGLDGKPLIAAYGHLGQVDVRAGQSIARGDRVGTLGNNFRNFDCIVGVRHLHLQLGRTWRGPDKGSYWGHVRYLKDGKRGTNPHLYWADGPGRVTCFKRGQQYPAGTLTYPLPCG